MFDDLVWVRTMASTGAARALRVSRGLSLSEIAREVGVDIATVSRWERGLRRPGTAGARRWAQVLRRLGA